MNIQHVQLCTVKLPTCDARRALGLCLNDSGKLWGRSIAVRLILDPQGTFKNYLLALLKCFVPLRYALLGSCLPLSVCLFLSVCQCLSVCLSVCLFSTCIYIYIYIYTCMRMYIYIYVYIYIPWLPPPPANGWYAMRTLPKLCKDRTPRCS